MEIRDRQVSTKNGKTGHVSSGISMGLAIRVLAVAAGASPPPTNSPAMASKPRPRWLSKSPRRHPRQETRCDLAPEDKYEAEWVSPIKIDPFAIPVDRNVALLLDIDRELRRNPGVTLAEGAMTFERRRQVSPPRSAA